MASLGNFNSVFEIAFGLNAVLYIYASRPILRQRLDALLLKRKSRSKYVDDLFPSVDLAPLVVELADRILHRATAILSVLLSIVSALALVWSGFAPSYPVTTGAIAAVIAIVLLPVPLLTILQHYTYEQLLFRQMDLLTVKLSDRANT